MAAVSLLSTTEGLAVVKDALKYLPLRKDIARDCLAARPFETRINLQRGLGAERSKIPNDTHELSPRGSRELALDLSEKTCSAIIKPTSSQHIEWNLDRQPLNQKRHRQIRASPVLPLGLESTGMSYWSCQRALRLDQRF